MLGLADKTALRRLSRTCSKAIRKRCSARSTSKYTLGVEPLAMMRSLMELSHRIAWTQIRSGPGPTRPTAGGEVVEDWAKRLSAGQVHRLWQLLLKGYDEVRTAPDPLVAAQMALLRVIHAADMPDPGAMIEKLASGEAMAAPAPAAAPKADSQGELLRAPPVPGPGRASATGRGHSRPAAARFREAARADHRRVPWAAAGPRPCAPPPTG